jgi:hypothetical protein
LPTSKAFLDLTDEQIELLFEHYLIDNPQLKQMAGEHFENPLYDEMEAKLVTDVNELMKEKKEVNVREIDIPEIKIRKR